MLDYDREFRLKILALCLDSSWMAKYGTSIISPSYFDRDDEHAFINSVMEYREKYKKSPSDPYDVIALCGGKFSTFILDMYELYDEGDFSLASDLVIQFAREQAAKIAILDSVDDVNAGRIQPAIDRMKEALKIGQNLLDSGLDPVRNIRDWLYDYWEEKTRTGFMHIDNVLQGGVLPGELSIILAPPNRGKSMALINVGYSVASIGSGKNVLHFTHEMSKQQTAKRYAARMVFRFPKHLDNLETYAEDVVETARKLLTGTIKIIDGRKSQLDIEAHIEQLIGEGFEPHVIIDDYLDLVFPSKHYSERRYELSALYSWYRDIGARYNTVMWSASQAGRSSLSKEIITMADIAEDIGKANIADVIIALCQTREEEMAEQCRLFLAKVRDGDSKAMVRAKYYKKSQAIVTTGIVTQKDSEQDV